MPRKQLNIGWPPSPSFRWALTAKIGQNQGFSGILAGSPCRISPGEALQSRRTNPPPYLFARKSQGG